MGQGDRGGDGALAAARDAEKWSGVVANPVPTHPAEGEKEHQMISARCDANEGYDGWQDAPCCGTMSPG
jgi:hypothetical protein